MKEILNKDISPMLTGASINPFVDYCVDLCGMTCYNLSESMMSLILFTTVIRNLIEYEVKKTAPHLRMPTGINTLIHSWDLK
jgi:hypothetical protein